MTDRELYRLRRSELIERLRGRGRTIAALNRELERSEARNGELKDEIDELKSGIEQLKSTIVLKDAELAKMAKQLEETYKRLAHKLDIKDNRIRELKAILLQLHSGADLTSVLNAPEPEEDIDRAPRKSAVRIRRKKTAVKVHRKPVKRYGR